jgi:hypothetical protein
MSTESPVRDTFPTSLRSRYYLKETACWKYHNGKNTSLKRSWWQTTQLCETGLGIQKSFLAQNSKIEYFKWNRANWNGEPLVFLIYWLCFSSKTFCCSKLNHSGFLFTIFKFYRSICKVYQFLKFYLTKSQFVRINQVGPIFLKTVNIKQFSTVFQSMNW